MTQIPRTWLVVVVALLACRDSSPSDDQARVREAMLQRSVSEVDVDQCEVIVDGSDDIIRALVNTRSGMLIETTVVDGHMIHFVCPPAEDRHDANIIAERANREIIHWSNVGLSPASEDSAKRTVNRSAARVGLPEELELERLHAKWGDVAEPAQPAEPEVAPIEVDASAPAKPEGSTRIKVSFRAHRLDWAKLKLELPTGYIERFELNPNNERSLAPGRYPLEVQLKADGEWIPVGRLELPAGKRACTVQMLADPPRPMTTCE